ncbi:6-phosphogluconate dehydrogenase [Aspergillus lucknowensis]|uniref:6-phosphogluconate dehydrogenase n=1 Tax=Aspergillus lucknowensis TaxID=176173 RepID=A0ABR4M7L9_9EURO
MADGLVIGILSIGDMGLGIAKLLQSQGYKVATFAEDRSERTQDRARSSGIELLPSIPALVSVCTCILSIVPPRDALETAKRVADSIPTASASSDTNTNTNRNTRKNPGPLYYLDLNATAPSLARELASLFTSNKDTIFIDGGIIGGPPSPLNPNPQETTGIETVTNWTRPSLITSGPTLPPSLSHLTATLNIEHIGPGIGSASTVKMCFASTTKGFIALAIQAFVTADAMGVLPHLRGYMEKHNKAALAAAERGVVGMAPKAYRWVNEMQQIGQTMEEEGGFGSGMFDGAAEVYRLVAEDTALGLEQPGRRARGTTVEDVVAVMREGMKNAKEKVD